MKKIIFLIIPVLLFVSCGKDDVFPRVENITKGQKWTLQIGSSPSEVYGQLQKLGVEKNFDDVGIVSGTLGIATLKIPDGMDKITFFIRYRYYFPIFYGSTA